jgi:ribosomal peptide maturation radical SAM protein 1
VGRRGKDKIRILLIAMPWAKLEHPSIQLGILKSILEKGRLPTETWSAYIDFADYVVDQDGLAAHKSPLTHLDYDDIATSYHVGDWIFSVPPFNDTSGGDSTYFERLRETGFSERLIAVCRRFRSHVPGFLQAAAQRIADCKPSVVGFTTTFGQTVPSLVLAKLLKARLPDLKIVFGGANCDGPMGDAILRAFEWVDVAVKGEAENVVVPLFRRLLDSGDFCQTTSVRCAAATSPGTTASDPPVAVDDGPTPDYLEYFSRVASSRLASVIRPEVSIPFETSRGCWWGAKHHCTFCGLNGSSMAFRAKSPSIALEQLLALSERYKCLRFHAVDNIIDLNYLQTFLPRISALNLDLDLFYEVKSNLNRSQVAVLADAGVRQIQPGIESLSTPILKLMKKGVSAMQNIRLLRWCEEEGIKTYWNLLYGFPGEPADAYDAMARLASELVHLQPPHLNRLGLQRFSPYFERAHDFDLEIEGPVFHYAFAYPCSAADLFDLAYDFSYRYLNHPDPETYVATLRSAVEAWRTAYFERRPTLTCKRGPDFVRLVDRRWPEAQQDFLLEGIEADIYLACEDGATVDQIINLLRKGKRRPRVTANDVIGFLDQLCEAKLVYWEAGVYLGLACRTSQSRSHLEAQSQIAAGHAEPAFSSEHPLTLTISFDRK